MTPIYIKIREGKVHRTIHDDTNHIIIDYNRQNKILGIEFIEYVDFFISADIQDEIKLKKKIRKILK